MFKGYKTIVFNILAAVIPFLELTELLSVIPQEYLPVYALFVAALNMLLRSVTTTPVGKGA